MSRPAAPPPKLAACIVTDATYTKTLCGLPGGLGSTYPMGGVAGFYEADMEDEHGDRTFPVCSRCAAIFEAAGGRVAR